MKVRFKTRLVCTICSSFALLSLQEIKLFAPSMHLPGVSQKACIDLSLLPKSRIEQQMTTRHVRPHLFIILVPFITTLDIETEKSNACKEEVIVTAMVENMDDNTTAYLFSGKNVWTMVIENHTLLRVDIIGDRFKDVTGPIESAAKNPFENKLYFLTAKQGFMVTSDETRILPYDFYMNTFKHVYRLQTLPKMIGCSAAYKVAPDNSEATLIAVDGSSFHCFRHICDAPLTPSQEPCQSLKKVFNPNHVDSKELTDCQGLIIDDGLEPFEKGTCTKESSHKASDKSRFRMLFADRRTLRYWEGDELKYGEDLRTVFNCKSKFIVYAAVALLIGSVVVAAVVILVILFYVRTIKLKDFNKEETMTVQTAQDTPCRTGKPQALGSGTKSHKLLSNKI